MKRRWLTRDLHAWARSGRKPVLVLTGARQTGKTTLARPLTGRGFEYAALDDPLTRSEISRLPAKVFARRFPAAVLDEVQKAPSLVDVVKAVVDAGGPERYLLLGSSQILLLQRVRESLAGRVMLRELFPLSLAEACTEAPALDEPAPAPFLLTLLEEGWPALHTLPPSTVLHPRGDRLLTAMERLLERGGMPGVWQGDPSHDEVREELETYARLYLERDLADLARLRDLDPFFRLQQLAAERTATVLNASELARDAGISHGTVRTYLRYLELSYQVTLLRPWFANRSKRLIRSPRLHWLDTGVWRAVTRTWGTLSGPLYESAVVAEVLKVLTSFRPPWEPFHLRTYDGTEVDVLLVHEGRAIAMEIKKAGRVSPADARHLRRVEQLTGLTLEAGLVVHRGLRVEQLGPRLMAVPDALLFGEAAAPR